MRQRLAANQRYLTEMRKFVHTVMLAGAAVARLCKFVNKYENEPDARNACVATGKKAHGDARVYV